MIEMHLESYLWITIASDFGHFVKNLSKIVNLTTNFCKYSIDNKSNWKLEVRTERNTCSLVINTIPAVFMHEVWDLLWKHILVCYRSTMVDGPMKEVLIRKKDTNLVTN